jgi:hypothetical protein
MASFPDLPDEGPVIESKGKQYQVRASMICPHCSYLDFLFECFLAQVVTRVARCFFSNQKSQFGKIFDGLRLKIFNTLYGHLKYFQVNGICILWHIGHVVVIWYIFPRFGLLHQEKSGNPLVSNVSY